MNSLTLLKYYCDIFVDTMATILEQKHYIQKKKAVLCWNAVILGKKIYGTFKKQHGLPDALSKGFSFKCLSVMI